MAICTEFTHTPMVGKGILNSYTDEQNMTARNIYAVLTTLSALMLVPLVLIVEWREISEHWREIPVGAFVACSLFAYYT